MALENHGESVKGGDEVVETKVLLLVGRSKYSQNLVEPYKIICVQEPIETPKNATFLLPSLQEHLSAS